MAGLAIASVAGLALAAQLSHARPNQTVRIPAGVYQGRFVVTAPGVTLEGSPGTVLEGTGQGTVLTIRGPHCIVRGLRVEGSGLDVFADDAAVRLDHADGSRLVHVQVGRSLTGVYALESNRIAVTDCTLEGNPKLGIDSNGDGIHLFHSSAATVSDCDLDGFRDGLYVEFSPDGRIRRNRVRRNHRYGLHVMFAGGTHFSDCRFLDNAVGSVLMYSKHVVVEHNYFAHQRGAIGQALTFKENDDGEVIGNHLVDNTMGLFIDGSERNVIKDNVIVANGWGVLLFASSRDNTFTGNSFVSNDFELAVDMPSPSNHLRGNYWSGNHPCGAVTPYNPVRPFAFLAMQHPDLMAFAGSPASRALDSAFQMLPGLLARTAEDPAPLAAPPSSISVLKEASR